MTTVINPEKLSFQDAVTNINDAASFMDIAKVFNRLFNVPLPGQTGPEKPDSYKDENSDYGLKEKGIKTRERLNAAAKEILDRVKDSKDMTESDIATLKQYSGKGGLAEGSQYEYYTPQHVAEGCWDALRAQGFKGGNVCDPCTGAGMFEATKDPSAIITGCDLDKTSSRIAQLLHPAEKIENKPFEQLAIETPDNTFDAVITNVPFGSARGKYKHIDAAYKNEGKIERYFILRALQKVRPGGLAVFVCPTNIVGAKGDGNWTKWRTEVSKLAEFMGAHKLPSKTFKNQGTDTVVDVVVFRRHPETLLGKIGGLTIDTLKAANVVWDQFIQGKYWQGEGKKFIMGTYVPKIDGDRFSREAVDGDIDDAGLKAKLAAKFDSRIDWAMLEDAEPVQRVYADGDRKLMNGAEYEFMHGQWIKIVSTTESTPIDKDKFGAATLEELRGILEDPRACMSMSAQQAFEVWKNYPELMTELPSKAIEFAMRQPKVEYQEQLWRGSLIGGMIGRYQARVSEGESDEAERASLQEIVAQEVMKYGHPANCKGLSVIGADSRMYGVFKNSLDTKGNYSDLLNGTLEGTGNHLQFDPSNLQGIVDHLFVREGLTEIQLEDVQSMYTGGKSIATLGDLAECEEVAITPDGIIMPLSRYCAGDIYPKIDALTLAMAEESDPRLVACYQRQLDIIGRKAKITPLHEIDFTINQKWIPKTMIRDHLKDSGYVARYGVYQDVQKEDALTGQTTTASEFIEDYDTPFGEWQIASLAGRGYKQDYSFEKKNSGFQLNLEKHLNGKSILDRVEKDEEGVRNDYLQKLAALNAGLSNYISGHPDVEEVLAAYNRKMNGYVPFDYDEGDLGLKGTGSQIKLHTYQNSAVRRLSEEGCGILAHNVGLGKSFQALALAKYNVQMGRSKKTCIVVPNAVLSNWYHEAKMLYGDLSSALFVGIRPELDKDGSVLQIPILDEQGQPKVGKDGKPLMQDSLKSSNSAEAVYNSMWQIPGSNASLVIMTHERFGQIPLKQESKDAYVEVMKEDMKTAKAKIDEAKKKKKKGGYSGAVEDERNEGKLSDEGTKKRGDFPFFEDMGITDVIIDEAHGFKNGMAASGTYDRMYYLPNTAPSQRALDMAMKLHNLKMNNNGRGAYFLTATPITNSLNEVYAMLSHVIPREEFINRGIYTLDDFLSTFGEFKPVDKLKADGKIYSGEGLTGFMNMDGLRDLFFKYCNMKNATQVEELRNSMPEAVKVTQEVSLTGEQATVYESLRKEAEDAGGGGLGLLRKLDKATTDLDLYYNRMTWHFPLSLKANAEAMVKSLPASVIARDRPEPGDPEYDDELPEEAEQPIVEMTVYLKDTLKMSVDGDTFIVVTHAGYEDEVLGALSKHKIPEDEISHPISPKYAALIENCKKEMEANGKQIIFSEEKAQHKKIVRILVHQIPALRNKVGIINATEAKGNELQKISDSYNTGVLVYIIANRKAEVGVNLQKGTTAIHHLTYPWTKASLTQREGRGVRQGNTAKKVTLYYYQAKGTVDMMRLDLIEHKGALIDDIAEGSGNRATNGDADPSIMAVMFAKDPEEARRKMKEQLEAKKAAEAESMRRSLLNQFTAYASNMQLLATIEGQREAEKSRLNTKIAELEASIADAKAKGAALYDGHSQRIMYSQRVQRDTETLDKRKAELANVDIKFDLAKTKAEGNVKKAASTLKAAAANGTLPIDPALLDHPEDTLMTADGSSFLSKGEMYEVSKYTDGTDPCIIKITSVANGLLKDGITIPYKGFTFEQLTGKTKDSWSSKLPGRCRIDSNDMVPLSQFLSKDSSDFKPVRCTYSEKEIELQRKLAEPVTAYMDIVVLGKDFFQEYYDKLKFSFGGYIGRGATGTIGLFRDISKDIKIVFPDTTDESLRKAVAEVALQKQRDNSLDYWTRSMLSAFFGADWTAAIAEYGAKAEKSDVIKHLTDGVKTALAGKTWRDIAKGDFPAGGYSFDFASTKVGLAKSAQSLGDNTGEIQQWVQEFFKAIADERSAALSEVRAEEEKAKLEAIKNHPDCKEVPEQIRTAFDRIGITVKVNTGDIILPGFKRSAGTRIAAFSRWFLQSQDAGGGKLRTMKEQVKGQFKAEYFKDAGGEFYGSWWHMDSKIDLSRVFDLLS